MISDAGLPLLVAGSWLSIRVFEIRVLPAPNRTFAFTEQQLS